MEMGKNVKPCDGDEDSDEDQDDDVDDGDGDGDVYDGEFYSQIWYIFVLDAAGHWQGGQQAQGDGAGRQAFDQTYDFAIGTRKEWKTILRMPKKQQFRSRLLSSHWCS